MRVHYISPSTLPSRTANSVHVAWQCDGLVKTGADVTLYAKRSIAKQQSLGGALETTYGIDAKPLTVVSFFSTHDRATSAMIAAMAAMRIGFGARTATIISRNLYASFLFGVLQRRPLIFETHQLEQGARKRLQRLVMTRPWIITVVISAQLVEHLARHHGVAPRTALILHDAAPSGIVRLDDRERRATLKRLVPIAAGNWDAVCGYFGQLYVGRGIEIVEGLAAASPGRLFLVYGGGAADIRAKRAANIHPNLHFMDHVTHPEALRIMRAMDVLLMPYQKRVSIGVRGHDTANWMSPMKMFEYLAAGVPIVASDLPSVREVLQDHGNCLMVTPDRLDAWRTAVDQLVADRPLARSIGLRAHEDYRSKHTWILRAEALLNAARTL
jgi:hypothetical protein